VENNHGTSLIVYFVLSLEYLVNKPPQYLQSERSCNEVPVT